MKKTLPILGSLLALFLTLALPSGCYYDNEQELYGIDPNACDTTLVKYGTVIKPLIERNCLSCHAPGGVQESVPFNTYESLKTYATNGLLVQRTNDATTPMPQSGLLPLCDRNEIQAWVKRGAPND
jgi:hypothetical protein